MRAYRESYSLGGLTASPTFYYPGFEHAVPPNAQRGPDLEIRPYVTGDPHLKDSGFQINAPIVGTWYEHILSLTGDPASGYIAKVCSWHYAAGVQQPNGQYSYADGSPPNTPEIIDPFTGSLVYRITLTPPPPGSNQIVTSQRGSSPIATTDVFGAWKIRRSIHLSTDHWLDEPNDWPQTENSQDQKNCVAKAPDPYEKRRFYIEGEHSRSDYPALPAEPGWPAAGT